MNGVGSVGSWVVWEGWVREFAGGLDQLLALVTWVAWVQKIFARVKKLAWIKILVRVALVPLTEKKWR